MLTDTDENIQGIQEKCRTIGNCNIPARESRLWGTKWYLVCAHVCMLRYRVFGFFSITIFNWTIKNWVSRRGSSKSYACDSLLSQDLLPPTIQVFACTQLPFFFGLWRLAKTVVTYSMWKGYLITWFSFDVRKDCKGTRVRTWYM